MFTAVWKGSQKKKNLDALSTKFINDRDVGKELIFKEHCR